MASFGESCIYRRLAFRIQSAAAARRRNHVHDAAQRSVAATTTYQVDVRKRPPSHPPAPRLAGWCGPCSVEPTLQSQRDWGREGSRGCPARSMAPPTISPPFLLTRPSIPQALRVPTPCMRVCASLSVCGWPVARGRGGTTPGARPCCVVVWPSGRGLRPTSCRPVAVAACGPAASHATLVRSILIMAYGSYPWEIRRVRTRGSAQGHQWPFFITHSLEITQGAVLVPSRAAEVLFSRVQFRWQNIVVANPINGMGSFASSPH